MTGDHVNKASDGAVLTASVIDDARAAMIKGAADRGREVYSKNRLPEAPVTEDAAQWEKWVFDCLMAVGTVNIPFHQHHLAERIAEAMRENANAYLWMDI